MAQAILDLRAQAEATVKTAAEKSSAWVKDTLEQYFSSPEAETPRTTSMLRDEVLQYRNNMPMAYAQLLENDKNRVYNIINNRLKIMREQRVIRAEKTAKNARGKDAFFYSKLSDASANWDINIDAGDGTSRVRAEAALREWLSADGAVLDQVYAIVFTRKTGGSKANEQTSSKPQHFRGGDANEHTGNTGSRPAARRRKPRTTSGSD